MSTLPADEPGCTETPEEPTIDLVIEGRRRDVGTITVARVLPSPRRRMVGPFIFLDHMGPVVLAPGQGFDIRPHPHIGLSTVTYLFAGENVHRDSLGTIQHNRPGDLNLMTAGRGIVHSERADDAFRAGGGPMHGVQLWVALPDAHEDGEPSFAHHPERTLPAIAPADGVRGRVLIGALFGARSPVEHPSDPLLVDLELAAGASVAIAGDAAERGVVVIEGELAVDGQRLAVDQMAVLAAGTPARLAAAAPARAIVVGGPRLGARYIEWNFVASTRDRIDRARDAWQARRFPVIPSDADEFVPYPT